jgi:hypothetical protein
MKKKSALLLRLMSRLSGILNTKGGKQGYHNLINETLKKIVRLDIAEQNGFEEILRKIIREELAAAGNAH